MQRWQSMKDCTFGRCICDSDLKAIDLHKNCCICLCVLWYTELRMFRYSRLFKCNLNNFLFLCSQSCFWMRLWYFTGSLAEFLNLVIKVTRTDLMRLAPLLIRKSTQAALMNQRKPLHALIMTRFRQIWNPGCYSSLTVFHLNIPISRYMRTF